MIIQMVHNEKAPLNRHNQYTMRLNHHLQTCQWRVFAEILAASYLKNWQEEKERLGDKLTFMPCKSSTQGWGLKSKVTLSSGWEYWDGRQTNGSSLYLGLVLLFYCWTVSPITIFCAAIALFGTMWGLTFKALCKGLSDKVLADFAVI